jgi:hypothetical protein
MIDQLKRIEALEARLALVEDQEKIRRLLARYAYNADVGRTDEYMGVWAEGGVYDLGTARHDGKAEIRGMMTSPSGVHKADVENRSLHTVCNLFIQVEGQTAWAEGYSVVFVRGPDGINAYSAGYNHWDFVRDGDGWLMTLRLRRAVGGPEWGGETLKGYLTVSGFDRQPAR